MTNRLISLTDETKFVDLKFCVYSKQYSSRLNCVGPLNINDKISNMVYIQFLKRTFVSHLFHVYKNMFQSKTSLKSYQYM